MEYGEIDLSNLLTQNPTLVKSPNFIKNIWEQMLRAVAFIHAHDIVHADLKPANFMVCKGVLKLIDFGIAGGIGADTTNIHREHQVKLKKRVTIIFLDGNS